MGWGQPNEMNFGLDHAPDAGLIARPLDLQCSLKDHRAMAAPYYDGKLLLLCPVLARYPFIYHW